MAYAAKELFGKHVHSVLDTAIYNKPWDIPKFNVPSAKKEIWKDHFEEGLRHLQENKSNSAELSLSKALKILSASPNAKHLNKEKATCFHTMAEIYSTRASQQVDDDGFCEMMVKSIALFEAERIYKYGSYNEDKEIDTAIFNAEVKFISKVFGLGGADCYRKMENKKLLNRQKLAEIRSKLTNEYFPALDKLPDWNSGDEERRCIEIENIYKQVNDDMKCLVVDIFSYCCQIAGPAPCKFSVIGLGSMSRQEVTPYSDLEFAILVETNSKSPSSEQRQYLRFLTYLFQVQIIQLGETILPSVGISSLNDFYSGDIQDDWFYDDVIPKGFSFDGMMPWASKTPLGRKEWRGQPRQEYIMTVDEMLKLQDVTPGSSLENLKTANVFSSVCHLFGDEELTKTYRHKLSSLITNAERKKSFQEQVLQIMQSLLETYHVALATFDFGSQQDVKKEVYRLASLLVEQLSKYFGILGQSSWQCIQEMKMKKILTEDGAKNLRTVLSITTELRLKCYQRQGRQKEALPTVPQLSVTEEKCTPCSFTTAILRLYKSLSPLTSAISKILRKIKNPDDPLIIALSSKPDISQIYEFMKNHALTDPETIVVKTLQQEIFLDVSPLTTALAYLRILQLPKAIDCLLSARDDKVNVDIRVGILLLLANCYQMVGRFQEAIGCCGEVQTLHTELPDFVQTSQVLSALISTMDAYFEQGLLNDAVKLHAQIINLQDQQDSKDNIFNQEKVTFLNRSAVLFMRLKQYNKAEGILRSILERLRNHRKPPNLSYFMTLNNLAVILLCEDRLEEAKAIMDDALTVAGEIYGENAVHPYFAHCLINLSEVHYHLENMEEAERFLRLALVIYSRVHDYEKEMIDPGIVHALIIKARIHQYYKQRDEVFSTLKKANEISKNLYGGQPHPNSASIILHLGFCEQERGNFSEALHHYQEYLKIHENQRVECQESRQNCKTAEVLLRIAHLGEDCSYDASYLFSCNEKALEMEETIHGKKANHPHLVGCLASLGYRLMTANRESEGVEYVCKSLEMLIEINLGGDEAVGKAHLSIAEIFGISQHSPRKAEKHLRSAEKLLKEVLGEDSHVSLLQINSSLLEIFTETNRIEEGLELAEKQARLIDIMLSKCNCPSSHQLYQVYCLALFYENSGRRNTAKEMYTELIGRIEEQVDTTDSDQDNFLHLLWIVQLQVGELYRTSEMFGHAEAMFQRILLSVEKTTSQRLLGNEVRHSALFHLSAIFVLTGRYHQAHELLDSLINVYEEDRKSINAETASWVFLIRGELYRKTSCFNLALEDLEKALKAAKESRLSTARMPTSTTANEIVYAKIMNAFGLVHEENNNPNLALEYYICSLSAVEGMPPKIDTAIFHQNKADVLKMLGQTEDAILHYKKSLEIREMLFSEDPNREDIATVIYNMALTQFIDKRTKEASKTLEKLLPLRKELLKEGGLTALLNHAAALILKGNCHIAEPGEAQQAKEAYEEAEKAVKRLTGGQPNRDYAAVLNNLGCACFSLNQWEEAIPKLEKALEMRRIIYEGKAEPDVVSTCHLLARALFENQEYQKALPYFEETLKYFEDSQSPDDETNCALHIALCHKSLKNHDVASAAFEKVNALCARKSVSDGMRKEVYETMADTLGKEENTDGTKHS